MKNQSRKTTSFTLKPSTRERIEDYKARRGGSMSEVIEEAVNQYLDRQDEIEAQRELLREEQARLTKLVQALVDLIQGFAQASSRGLSNTEEED
jgi:Arc/MetJ-type ribon-helix-helix transcriptional regulator